MILRGISMQNWLAAALQVVPPPREADGKPAQDQAPPQEEPAPEEVGSWGKGGEQMQTRRGGRGGGGGGDLYLWTLGHLCAHGGMAHDKRLGSSCRGRLHPPSGSRFSCEQLCPLMPDGGRPLCLPAAAVPCSRPARPPARSWSCWRTSWRSARRATASGARPAGQGCRCLGAGLDGVEGRAAVVVWGRGEGCSCGCPAVLCPRDTCAASQPRRPACSCAVHAAKHAPACLPSPPPPAPQAQPIWRGRRRL